MPKTKPSPHQSPLFHRIVPQMSEGYYSSGPNPNLRRFVEEHSHPYDPETDDYNVPPFDQPITTTKATAIYNMHTYWSKKPHDAIQQYIRHYTQPDDIVLDPFCGSGGTALAALMEGRAAIAIDLSPAATFITKNYCTPIDVDELQRAFEELKQKVQPEMDWLYETRCDRCDGRATTAYTVYSYIFQCPRCLEKVPLFDCPEAQSQTAAGKQKTIRVCPHCRARGLEEEISTSSQRFDPIPVLVSYLCDEGCTPKRAERIHNDPNPTKRDYFEKYDLGKLAEIEQKSIPHWFPPHRMMNIESDTEPWGDEWRPGRNFRTVAELFTKRNLWALACYLNHIRNNSFTDTFRFLLTGSVLHGSKMSHFKEAGGGISVGTYYIPQFFKEQNILDLLSRKFVDITHGIQQVNLEIHNTSLCVSTQTSTNLATTANNSIDFIFTDPPYADKVQYGELNFIWEAWMGFDTHWHSQEVIVNESRGKTDSDWSELMRQALGECYRVLKPGHWISLCYHDTSEGTWQLLQDIMAEIGFISEHTETTLFIDAGQKSYNQTTAENVTKRDLVINFRKPRIGEIADKFILTGKEDIVSFSEKARMILVEALEAHPGRTADRLYDELVSRMVRRGEFERHNFDEVLRSVAEAVGEHWYLLETAGHVDETESKKEAAAGQRLESFMKTWLKERPGESGVHYSDLFEQYLPIGDKPRRLLQDWLPEYFFKTADGTWRLAKDEEERHQKAALRASGALRRIKRFANALLEGVPPYEKDKPENAATLADWIRQCRRAGLYELGRVLYEKGGQRFDTLGDESQMEVDEDYQVCVRRGAETTPAKKKQKKDQPELL